MTRPQQASESRLHRYIPVIAVLAFLGGCQANQADGPQPPRDDISLFGVRVGMTPDQLNEALPGAHCAPTTEHPTCQVPSTAMGSSGVVVQFANGRVISAYAEGGMGAGLRTISGRIAEQLGSSQQQRFDDTYADTWAAKDGSELALLAGHYITEPRDGGDPYATTNGYTLVLSSPTSRAQRAQKRGATQNKIERDLTNTLGQVFAIDPTGHVSVCGIHVGAIFDGHLGCPPDARAELLANSRFNDCGMMLAPHLPDPFQPKDRLALEAPTAKVCVIVAADAATRQVKSISASFPSEASQWSAVNHAFTALPNAHMLKSGENDELSVLFVNHSLSYENSFGDVVGLAMDDNEFAFGKPLGQSKKLLTVSIAGKTAEASFN